MSTRPRFSSLTHRTVLPYGDREMSREKLRELLYGNVPPLLLLLAVVALVPWTSVVRAQDGLQPDVYDVRVTIAHEKP